MITKKNSDPYLNIHNTFPNPGLWHYSAIPLWAILGPQCRALGTWCSSTLRGRDLGVLRNGMEKLIISISCTISPKSLHRFRTQKWLTGRYNGLQLPQFPCNRLCRCRRGPVVWQQETHTEVLTSMKTYQCSQRQPSLKVATVFLRTPDNVQSVKPFFIIPWDLWSQCWALCIALLTWKVP